MENNFNNNVQLPCGWTRQGRMRGERWGRGGSEMLYMCLFLSYWIFVNLAVRTGQDLVCPQTIHQVPLLRRTHAYQHFNCLPINVLHFIFSWKIYFCISNLLAYITINAHKLVRVSLCVFLLNCIPFTWAPILRSHQCNEWRISP